MSTAEVPAAIPEPLMQRIVRILTQPQTEWPVIEAEAADPVRLYREYIGILAAIPALGSFIGMSLIGVSVPLVGTLRVPILRGLANAALTYVLLLVGVYVAAVVIDRLAPAFESRSDQNQALKLVAYASTPAWLAGVLNIIPALATVGILFGLYAIYLFYLGLPVLMKTPPAKVIVYMIMAAVVVVVLNFTIMAVASSISGVNAFMTR